MSFEALKAAVSAKFPVLEGMLMAIFIGARGELPGVGVFIPSIHQARVPVDAKGRVLIPQDDKGNYKNPADLAEFSHYVVKQVYPGEVCFIPLGEQKNFLGLTALESAISMEQFAHPRFYAFIKEAYEAGKSGAEIQAHIKANGGLLDENENNTENTGGDAKQSAKKKS